ncbi:hypothetical protein BCR44DRAFT_1249718 [Catenaria anguillulae PL171]|uniref:Uncharacterized protein n=1 Tax=Catenaria anguillulae PL171 TaxID=765915 RepID=A0A1Y2I007_9FUNG|nr:hypothetical protein BCR44DRAFT_1249718 [Catenaria anguillulae PL171]
MWRNSKPSLLLLLSTLVCLAAVLASNMDTALVVASPYPSTNPFDRIIHILRRKIAEPFEGQESSDSSSSSPSGSNGAAAAAGPTTTVTVYLPARTDEPSTLDGQARNQADEDDGFAGIFGSGSGPRFTQSNGASAFGHGMGEVLASEARDASPQYEASHRPVPSRSQDSHSIIRQVFKMLQRTGTRTQITWTIRSWRPPMRMQA